MAFVQHSLKNSLLQQIIASHLTTNTIGQCLIYWHCTNLIILLHCHQNWTIITMVTEFIVLIQQLYIKRLNTSLLREIMFNLFNNIKVFVLLLHYLVLSKLVLRVYVTQICFLSKFFQLKLDCWQFAYIFLQYIHYLLHSNV